MVTEWLDLCSSGDESDVQLESRAVASPDTTAGLPLDQGAVKKQRRAGPHYTAVTQNDSQKEGKPQEERNTQAVQEADSSSDVDPAFVGSNLTMLPKSMAAMAEMPAAKVAQTVMGAHAKRDPVIGAGSRQPDRASCRQHESQIEGASCQLLDKSGTSISQAPIWTGSLEELGNDGHEAEQQGRQKGRARGQGRALQRLVRAEQAEADAVEKEQRKALKEAEKEEKKRARAEAKLQKEAAKAAEKASRQEQAAVRKALTGRDAKKSLLLRVSPRLMEAPWVAELISVLHLEEFEYRVDTGLPLGCEYACMRWARRMPRAAAAAFLESQSAAAALVLESQDIVPPDLSQAGPAAAEAEVLLPLLLLFLPPADLVAQLLPSLAAPPGPGQAAPSRDPAPGGEPALLHTLRARVAAAYPECTLMLACVDLERHLTQRERAPGSSFNRAVVLDALMDVGLRFPAVRLREDLKDGAHAAEFVAGLTRALADHHRRQQEGYLAAFGENKLSSSHPELEHTAAGTRTLAHALSHLLPADKAVKSAKAYRSLGALLQAYADPTKSRKEKENLLTAATAGIPGRGTIGATASSLVFEYLTNLDANAAWRDSD